jgi:NRAMP (natural resistance-associated macrophage protein)-like metal ion transporter
MSEESLEHNDTSTTSDYEAIDLVPINNHDTQALNKAMTESTSGTLSTFSGSTASLPIPTNDVALVHETIKFATIDCIIALIFALIINSTILIVGASAFYYRGITEVEELQDAYKSLNEIIGNGTGTMFAVALLASGQSSTITGTMAGQVVMTGFLELAIRPWLRRLLTR